ncbi:hypothetical protein GOV12_00110, partial [Candidatus Pacearchaeota archaeon]|nr:hypothetical protein [Candidatus Pacearchaeota archaeon]
MDKRLIVVSVFLIVFLIPFVFADSVDNEISKITHYAEEYETGNINYPQLLVYTSSVREALNKELGSVSREYGGLIKEDQIENVLGEPTKTTRWVWVEKEHREIRMDEPVPVWEKIVFDGNKIQIRFEVFPSIFKKGIYSEDYEEFDDGEVERKKRFEENLDFNSDGVALIYRIHFNVEFKRPQEQLDISGKINDITSLGEIFNNDPSQSNAENLAKESVNAERLFENYVRQGGGDCTEVMNRVFGSENKRETQKLNVQEVYFHYGDNYEALIRVDMCGSCEWSYINLDMRIQGRGPGFKHGGDRGNENDLRGKYKGLSWSEYETKTRELINSAKSSMESNDMDAAFRTVSEIRAISQAWNEISNNVWEEVEKLYPNNFNDGVERDVYYWIEREIEKRNKMEQIKASNFEKREKFYNDLFSGYEKDEFYFEQISWEKRLIEEFMIEGKEICDNGIDDNEDEVIDCAQDSCGGQICGWTNIEVQEEIIENEVIEIEENEIEETEETEETDEVEEIEVQEPGVEEVVESESSGLSLTGNVVSEGGTEITETTSEATTGTIETSSETISETEILPETETSTESGKKDVKYTPKTKKIPMYCIEKKCQIRDEDKGGKSGAKCGNHVCEKGENIKSCREDCGVCEYDIKIECKPGTKAIFKGKDKNGCPLDPICIEEKESCDVDNDCSDPLCGDASCVEGVCKVLEIKECKEQECVDGDKKMGECPDGSEIINAICTEGMWNYLDIFCETGGKGEKIDDDDEIIDDECVTKSDCGGENDVCSNGKCVTIIEVVEGDGGDVVIVDTVDTSNPQDNTPVESVDDEQVEPEQVSEPEPEPVSEPAQVSEPEPVSEPTPVSEPEPVAVEPVTGNVIFNFISSLIFNPVITGNFITGNQVDEGGGEAAPEPAPEPSPEVPSEPEPESGAPGESEPSPDDGGDDGDGEPYNEPDCGPDGCEGEPYNEPDCGPDGCEGEPYNGEHDQSNDQPYNDQPYDDNFEGNDDWKQREENEKRERQERCDGDCVR